MNNQQKFIEALEATIDTVESLLVIAEKQLGAFRENNLEEINQIIQEQNVLLKKFSHHEEEVLAIQETLPVEDKNSDSPFKEKLETTKSILTAKVNELKEKNNLNDSIVKQNLAYIQHMVKTINTSLKQNNNQVYSQKGELKKEESNSIVNQCV